MTDLRFLGVDENFSSGKKAADPLTDVLLIGTISLPSLSGSSGSSLSLIGGPTTQVAGDGGTLSLEGGLQGNGSGTGDGGPVVIVGGSTTANAGTGGAVSLTGGSSLRGGSVSLTGGESTVTGFAASGHVTVTGGPNTNATGTPGGSVTIVGGLTTNPAEPGGSLILRGGSGAVTTDVASAGPILLGDLQTGAITIGGSGPFTSGGTPDTVSLVGHSTTQAATSGGPVTVTGGSSSTFVGGTSSLVGGLSTSSFGGSALLRGGVSTTATGGSAGIVGGDTSSSSQSGGNVSLRAGGLDPASFDPRHSGTITIGDANTGAITLGGSTYTTSSDATVPGRILIQGHSFTTAAPVQAGDVFLYGGNTDGLGSQAGVVEVIGGDSTGNNSFGGNLSIRPGNAGANGTPGNLLINAGISGAAPSQILIGTDAAQHPASSLVDVTMGSGSNIPVLTLRDGYITLSDTTATSDSNISGLLTPEANTLYAKSLVKAWGKATTGATPALISTTEVFNVASIAPSGTRDMRITYRRAMANASYSVQITNLSGTRLAFTVLAENAAGFTVRAYDYNAGTTTVDLNATSTEFGFVVHGRV